MFTVVATEEGILFEDILLTSARDIQIFIDTHRPKDLEVSIGTSFPSDLLVDFYAEGIYDTMEFWAFIGTVQPKELYALIGGHYPTDLSVNLFGFRYKDLPAWFRIFQHSQKDFISYIKGVYSEHLDFNADIHAFQYKHINAYIGGHYPKDFYLSMHLWQAKEISAIIGSTFPSPLPVSIYGDPEPGYNLPATLRLWEMYLLPINFYCMDRFRDIYISLYPEHSLDLETFITSQGYYKNLIVDTIGKSGYKILYITLRANLRRATTIIPIHTMEYTEIFALLNHGYFCGWGTGYKNFIVTFVPKPKSDFYVYLKVILGSLVSDLTVYINKIDFPYYLNAKHIQTFIPVEDYPIYFDRKPHKAFFGITNIVFNRKTYSFYHPRRICNSGISDFLVSITPSIINPYCDLEVLIKAYRPISTFLESTNEIELWGNDPWEVVRVVEIMFEEQVYEYIWVGAEQRAYSRELWDKWCLAAYGYKPEEVYGGQIEYTTLKTMCNLNQFILIDDAIKYLIDSMLLNSYSDLLVGVTPYGTYQNLSVDFDITSLDRLGILSVNFECFHLVDLQVSIIPQL